MAEEIDISGITDEKALRVIAQLLVKISVLEERIARLEKNSGTSSKPPSSDIVKPPHENRQPGNRKIGGQPGHKGTRHRLRSIAEVDRVERLVPKVCPECIGGLAVTSKLMRQQVYELVDKPVELIEYQRVGCYCERCDKIVYEVLPDGVREGQQYGERLQALLIYLKGSVGATYSELHELCVDVFKIKSARSGICNVVMRGCAGLEAFHRKIALSARKSNSLNIDESTWKRNGRLRWAWVFCNAELAFFSIEKSRGAKVVKKHLGANSQVSVTSDFLSSYSCIPEKKHQYCLAHLIRDIKFVMTLPDIAAKKIARGLLNGFRRIFSMVHRSDPPDRIKKSVQRLWNYVVRRRSQHKTLKPLLRRIRSRWFSLWRFIDHPDLFEPTNNRAERVIRHLVRLRKIAQGSRSKNGDRWVARFCSLLQTSRLRKQSVWTNLCNELASG